MTPEGIAGFLCGFEAKGRRDGTIRSYRRILERLYQGLPEDKGLDGERLARWERGLLDSGDSPRTVNVKIAAIYEPDEEHSYEIESSVLCRKEDQSLCDGISEVLQEMSDDGFLYDLTVEYFGQSVADSTSIYQ